MQANHGKCTRQVSQQPSSQSKSSKSRSKELHRQFLARRERNRRFRREKTKIKRLELHQHHAISLLRVWWDWPLLSEHPHYVHRVWEKCVQKHCISLVQFNSVQYSDNWILNKRASRIARKYLANPRIRQIESRSVLFLVLNLFCNRLTQFPTTTKRGFFSQKRGFWALWA